MKLQSLKSRVPTYLVLTLTVLLGIMATFCKKIEPERLIMVHTGSIQDITQTSVVAHATLLDVGGASGVSDYGFCYSLTPNLADITNYTQRGPKKTKGEYQEVVDGLTPGSRYHIWAYASDGNEKQYGKPLSFDTPPVEKPTLETAVPSLVTFNSVHSGGLIISDGGSEITARGLCWNTTPTPSIADFKTTNGVGTGEFGSDIDGLVPETMYYIRAYATNNSGTGYGNEQVFSTLHEPAEPEVVTGEIDNTGPTSTNIVGSWIANEGGASIITKGLCWSLNPNPTLDDIFLEYGSGPGPFTMEINELEHDTEYYIRAYATNSENLTGYGDQQAFRTLFLCGSILLDQRDMQSYPTIQMGDQCWMAKNLNVGAMVDTSGLLANNEELEKYCYDNDISNCNTFGGMYTWDEMMQFNPVEKAQGTCPDRWHIPSDGEWISLEESLGMPSASRDSVGYYRGTNNEGGMLKTAEEPPWNEPNTGATNSTHFSALPAGMIFHNGTSNGQGGFTVFWTSTSLDFETSLYRILSAEQGGIGRYEGYRPNTTSVRCVKD